jgi:hypothetical protein
VEDGERPHEGGSLRDQRGLRAQVLVNQAEQRRLAGTRAPEKSDPLAGPDREVDVMQHGSAGVAGPRGAE